MNGLLANNNNNNNLDGLISRQTGAASASLHQIMWKRIQKRRCDPMCKRQAQCSQGRDVFVE